MDGLEKIDIPVTEFICPDCRVKDDLEVTELPSPYVIFDVALAEVDEVQISVTVDVECIELKKVSQGQYIAQARVRIVCPCCESPRSIRHHIGASRLVLSSADVCSTCGGDLSIQDEEVTYDGLAASEPLVMIRGTLICTTCTDKEMSVQTHVPAASILEEISDVRVEVALHGARIIAAKPDESKKRRLLIVVANPQDSDQLRLANECRIIEKCIERGKERDFLDTKIIQAATVDDWARALLEDEYNIIHFSGHGTKIGLMLESETGRSRDLNSCSSQIVQSQALGKMLAAHESVECVVLNACFSSTHVQSSLSAIDYSIVMDGPISDKSAMEFSRGFYDALAAGKSIDFAFGEGCRRIDLKGLPGTELPLLYVKGVKVTYPGGQVPPKQS